MGIVVRRIETPRSGPATKIATWGRVQPAARPAAKRNAVARKPRSALTTLGLEDPRHGLLCAPSNYMDCTHPSSVVTDDLIGKPSITLKLRFSGAMRGMNSNWKTLWSSPSASYPTLNDVPKNLMYGSRVTEVGLMDDNETPIRLTLFSSPDQWKHLREGDTIWALGEIGTFRDNYTLRLEHMIPAHAAGQIWTQYRGIPGRVAGERVEALATAAAADESAVRACGALIMGSTGLNEQAVLSAATAAGSSRFESFAAFFGALHRPSSTAQGILALECARKMSAIAIQAAALRHHSRPAHPSAPLTVDPADLALLEATLPMVLTKSQREVASTVIRRLSEPVPLTALLSGDVGTGKTLAYLLPAVAAHRAGARVAIMTPRQLLADQIADQIQTRFGASITSIERIEASGRIMNPQSILVGTNGLTSVADKQGYVPQLLICDEQHKLSAATKEALVGAGTHVLEVSATPIPRSLAAALYDGMEILNLRECPVHKEIDSSVLDMSSKRRIVGAIRAALAAGERVAMVYPLVASGSEATPAQCVTGAFESFSKVFPNDVVMLHGEMDPQELKRNIAMLRSGERRFVIASTVLEIGIDIPSISVMVVRDADRFGSSQLHQLRGRLVRNGGRGIFMMAVENLDLAPPDALERLQAVASTNDGYELAELDLVQRGFGEIDGDAQSGASKTLFRLVRLQVEDFLARKLKTLHTEPATTRRMATPDATRTSFVQERLL